jgi:hypothetical protein
MSTPQTQSYPPSTSPICFDPTVGLTADCLPKQINTRSLQMHPHIPLQKPTLSVRLSSDGLVGVIHEDGLSFSFPIHGRAETALSNALLHITSGVHTYRIIEHFQQHNLAEPKCPCCILEGRILSGQGRKTVKSDDMFRAARTHSTGTVQVRHIKPGISGAQLKAYEAAYAKRNEPHSNVTLRVKQRIEDLI